MATANGQLVAYRGRSGDTVSLNDNTTWAANQNTSWTQATDTTFRVRFEAEETNTKTFTWLGTIEYSLNSGSWTAITTTSSVVKAVVSSQFADNDTTTNILTASARTFTSGYGSETGDPTNVSLSNTHSENEYALQIVGADVANNDTIVIRPASMTTYVVAGASITVSKPITLVISANTLSHTSGNVGLTQHQILAVDNAVHLQVTDAPILVVNLVVDTATHLMVDTSPTLALNIDLIVDNTSQLQIVTEPTLTAYDVAPAKPYYYYAQQEV